MWWGGRGVGGLHLSLKSCTQGMGDWRGAVRAGDGACRLAQPMGLINCLCSSTQAEAEELRCRAIPWGPAIPQPFPSSIHPLLVLPEATEPRVCSLGKGRMPAGAVETRGLVAGSRVGQGGQ